MPAAIRIYTILLLTMICYNAHAGKIMGKVIDEDGEALPFASIVVRGTTMGTSANAQGYYTLSLPDGKHQLAAQYIGYKQVVFELNLSSNESITHDFTLQVQGYELKDIVINSGGEDPAYRIIRNAIKQRTFHLNQLKSFQTNIYVKGVLRNRFTPNKIMGIKLKEDDKKSMNSSLGLDTAGKGVLYLCEELADYYTKGNKQKVYIQSVKESGNPNGLGLGSVPPVINFYENNVKMMISSGANDQGFVSPISHSALNYYTYKLLGNFQENGTTIFKIKLTPKRGFERCFIGDIYIAEDDWAIHSIKVFLTSKQGLDMLDTIRTEQQYIPLGKNLWVIKNQVFYPTINLLGFDITGNFVSVYNNQKVNETIPDSVFNKKIIISYQRNAAKHDSNYWRTLRPIALENDEFQNYVYKDSLHNIETDPHRIDSLRRKGNKIHLMEMFVYGTNFNTKANKTNLSITPILFDLNFNTVEGLNYAPTLAIKHKLDTGRTLSATSNLRYGFANHHFNAKINLSYTQENKDWANRNWRIALTGGKYISQFNQEQPVEELLNTFTSIFQQENFFKIYERWLGALKLSRNYGNGWQWAISMQYEQRASLSNSSNFSLPGKRALDPYTDNLPNEISSIPMPQHNVAIIKASISYQPGYTYSLLPEKKVPHVGNLPLFTLNYQKGIPNIFNSISDYDKLDFQIQDVVNLKRLGSLNYNANIGGFLNARNVPIPDMNHLFGNQFTVASPFLQSFQLAPYYRFSNTAKLYSTLHIEYYLKGLITNKIPLLRQAHWYFILGTNSFISQNNKYYTEAFIGIDNLGFKIFRGLRIDYVKGWDNDKRNYSGLRLGINTSTLGSRPNNNKAKDF